MFNDLPYGHAVPLAALFLLFAASALVVGRREGLKCLATLLLIPLLLLAMGWVVARGWLPAGQAALLAGLVALGFQVVMLVGRRSGAAEALLGACGGYLVAVALAVLAVFSLKITGIYSPLLRDLWYAPGTGHVNFHSLALGGIALAGAGIIADLAVAVTATVREVHLANPSLFRGRLRASGMRFGRDVICTEVNTLPLAILGASLGGILLVLVRPDVGRWPYTWMLLANRQSTAVEVAALVAGTVGLSLTIPLTAYLVSHRLGVRPVLPAGGKPPRTSPLPAFRAALAGWGGLLVVIAIFAAGLCWWLGGTTYKYPQGKGNTVTRLERGKVVSVDPAASPWAPRVDGPGAEKFQDVRVRVGGGEILAVENSLTGSPANDRVPEAGDAVIIQTQRAEKDVYARLMRISRDR
ncbi:MAG: YibE/F family protein, partial [Phycisphaerae bacterium]|nr:YibE/F family protein [Phycisphaerae bacterium]